MQQTFKLHKDTEFSERSTVSQDNQRRIHFVVNDSWFFASHRLPIAVAAIENGNEVHLSAVADHTSDAIAQKGVVFHPWSLHPRSRNPLKEIQSFVSLYRSVKNSNPDILHLVTVKSVLYGGIIARILNVRSVVFAISGRGYIYSTENGSTNLLKNLTNSLYRFALSHRNSTVIVQNTTDQNFFVDNKLAPLNRIRLIPGSGVDLATYNVKPNPKKSELPLILFASRMLWDKGVDDFVTAAKMINKNGIRAKFVLAGTADPNNPRSVPLAWLEALPEHDGIKWIGHCDDMADLIAQSSVVVLPSRYGEGVPKILIEAAAIGRPIVTTDWPGCNDAVRHEYNGLLSTPGDIKSLTENINKLIENQDLRCKFGKNSRTLAESTFSIENVIEQTLNIYDELQ